MEKVFDFSEELHASIDQVWEVIKKPVHIISEKNAKITIEDDLNWVQHDGEVDNECHATLDESAYKVHVVTTNTKYRTEGTDVILELMPEGSHCKVHVHYVIKTKAIFNMVVFKAFGEKLEHHATNVILKHIKKALK